MTAHAGRALRAARPRPARAPDARPTSSCSTSTGSRTARRSTTRVHYVRGVDHVLVNGTPVVADGEHTGAVPGKHLPRR